MDIAVYSLLLQFHTHTEDTKEAVGNSWDIVNTISGQNRIKIDQTRSYLAKWRQNFNKSEFKSVKGESSYTVECFADISTEESCTSLLGNYTYIKPQWRAHTHTVRHK